MRADVGTSIRYTLAMCALLCTAMAVPMAARSAQRSAMGEAKRFIGSGASGGSGHKLGSLDCTVYSSASGMVYVDKSSGQVVLVNYRSVRSSGRDIGIADARRKAMIWLKEHGIDMQGWHSEGGHRYDHGTAGVDYNFDWNKLATNGARLPAIMTVVISSAGELKSFLRVDRKPQVSTVPDISAKQALDKAARSLKMKLGLRQSPRLHMWYRNGKQRLYWNILFHAQGDPWCMGGAEVDAHTGELLNLYAPRRPKGPPGVSRTQ